VQNGPLRVRTRTGLERDKAMGISNPPRGRMDNVSLEFRSSPVRCANWYAHHCSVGNPFGNV
jgi:hypothetical protein